MSGSLEPSDSVASAPDVARRLNTALEAAGMAPLEPMLTARFAAYLSLLLRWNQRVNLTAIRDEAGIISRHFIESIVCARSLTAEIRTLLDLGSGAGFPGIPIALCRPEIAVTVAESQGKKAAFLQEVVRTLGLNTRVLAARAESESQFYDCVTLRAVDGMLEAVKIAAGRIRVGGWLALMTTQVESARLRPVVDSLSGPAFTWCPSIPLPRSTDRIFLIGQRHGPA